MIALLSYGATVLSCALFGRLFRRRSLQRTLTLTLALTLTLYQPGSCAPLLDGDDMGLGLLGAAAREEWPG